MEFCTSSRAVHVPFFFASSITAMPAGVISPSRIIRSARSRFALLQLLFGFLRAKKRYELSPSRLRGFESIQPKQSASSSASALVTEGFPLSLWYRISQTLFALVWFFSNQSRHVVRSLA